MQTHFFHLGYKSWKWLPGVSRHNRPCLLCKVTTRVKVKPAIFGLGAHAPEASPVVSGLQKPPAGSGRGRGRGRKWSCLEGDVDMGGGDPFHTGDGATQKASTCGPVLTEPCRAFSTHGCKRGTSLPHHPHTQASLCSMGLGLYFKFTWSPEEMRKKGEEEEERKQDPVDEFNCQLLCPSGCVYYAHGLKHNPTVRSAKCLKWSGTLDQCWL